MQSLLGRKIRTDLFVRSAVGLLTLVTGPVSATVLRARSLRGLQRKAALSELDDLKKDVFFRLLGLAGRVFVVARPASDVSVGKRGFVGDEKNDGITLVFNEQMKFDWDDIGIKATLAFGSSLEKCDVPAKDIVAIYSPELGVQFNAKPGAAGPDKLTGEADMESSKAAKDEHPVQRAGNVIKVDFNKRED